MTPAEKDAIKAQHGQVFEEFAEILFRRDPQLINYDINPDEYEFEVAKILPRVINVRSSTDLIPVLKEEFFAAFSGSGIINPDLTWEELSNELFAALERRRAAAV